MASRSGKADDGWGLQSEGWPPLPEEREDGALGQVENGRRVEAELDGPPERDGEGC